MPATIISAIETASVEVDEILRAQQEYLQRLRHISAEAAPAQRKCKREVVATLQAAGILDGSKKLAKEYQ